jgi:hypothetical protein
MATASLPMRLLGGSYSLTLLDMKQYLTRTEIKFCEMLNFLTAQEANHFREMFRAELIRCYLTGLNDAAKMIIDHGAMMQSMLEDK